MTDFVEARRMMVDGQVRTNDVTDLRIQSAMLELPRERFVPADRQALAYLDLDVPLRAGAAGKPRCLLKPMVLAKLLHAAEIDAGDRALDVGGATGYSSAVVARLAQSVVALEEDASLAAMAKSALAELGIANVTFVTGPLTQGHAAQAPYDVILVNGTIEITPHQLLAQLQSGGRLVAMVANGPIAKGTVFRRSRSGNVSSHSMFDAAAPLLPGFAKPVEFVF